MPTEGERSETAARVRARIGRAALVGRAPELTALRDERERALRAGPRLLLLAGEAGIGKSRMLAELATDAAADWLVLLGHCLDEQGLPPYLPWLSAISAGLAALRRESGASRGEGIRRDRTGALLGDLRRRLAGGADEPADEPGDPARGGPSPEEQRLRLYDAVCRAVEDLAARRPLLLAFDDLQWSDAASNELLRYLLVQTADLPLLVVGAYRAEEAAANRELQRTAGELGRRRLATTIHLRPFALPDTARLIAALLGRDAPGLAAAVHRYSDGVPFVVEEVVRELAETGRLAANGEDAGFGEEIASLPPPAGVTAIVERRLGAVGTDGRAVLEVAALAGPKIAVDLVAAAAGRSADEASGALREAAAAALVRQVAPAEAQTWLAGLPVDFVFGHDTLREAIAAGIDGVRSRTIHGRLADGLTALRGSTEEVAVLAALTHHLRQAGRHGEAAERAERLGDASVRAHAYADAAAAYRLTVELRDRTGSGDRVAGDLLLKLGDAALAAGAADAIAAFATAETAFAAAEDRRGVARSLRRLGTAHARREAFDAAVAHLEAASEALGTIARATDSAAATDDVEAELAEVLIELGSVLGVSAARYDEAIRAGRRALRLAERGREDRPALAARAQLALAQALMRSGLLDQGRDLLSPALALALRAGRAELAAEVAGAIANHAYWTGDLDASEQAARQRGELAESAGDPYALRHVDAWLANLALARGRWEEAEGFLAKAEARLARVPSPEPRAFLRQVAGLVRLRLGRFAEAVALLEEAVAGFRASGPATLVWYLGCLAHAYLRAGDAAAARRAADETAALVDELPHGSLPRAPALAQLGIVAARTNDTAAAERWYGLLQPYRGQHHWVLVDRVLGLLAGALGDAVAAERHLTAATRLATRGGIRPELALSLAERGAIARRAAGAGAASAAQQAGKEGLSLLRELGMTADADRFAPLLTRPTPAAPPPPRPAALTEREVEVLRLVAGGLTNREIAARLHLSEKTVANHLSHVFAKADLENRAAAVAYALRLGLA